jgi:NADP-dependent 3-hydroxy acid dehydrogenase YdfG
MNMERQTIFITGAASGIGLATARLFANNGWFVGIYDVDKDKLQDLASELGSENCHVSTLDVSDRSAFQIVLQNFAERTSGKLDLLFNNAGIGIFGLFGEMDFSDIERIMQVNFMGVINGIHSAYDLLKNTPNSLCFTTSSSSGVYGFPGLAIYSATKHGVKGLTEALSTEFALIDTRAADTLPANIDTAIQPEEAKQNAPDEGTWRFLPAEAVAEVVWASYHDKTGKLHWYVPDELFELEEAVTANVENVRDGQSKLWGIQ